MSAASRPVAMRTSDWRGARRVASTTCQRAVDVGLDDGVEVHRRETGGVDGGEAGRHVRRPAEGDVEVGEVAAHAPAGSSVSTASSSGPLLPST